MTSTERRDFVRLHRACGARHIPLSRRTYALVQARRQARLRLIAARR